MKTFAGRKLGRPTGHRLSLLKNMAASLLEYEKITTTVPKAKEVSRFTEKIIGKAKQEGLSARRNVAQDLARPGVQKKLFEVLVPRYQSRNGGYTQLIRVGPRQGDGSEMAVVRLLP